MKNEKKESNNYTGLESQEIMINYLKGNNSQIDDHETEKALMNDPFAADALEGLYGKLNTQELIEIQNNINNYITQRITNKKARPRKTIFFPLWIVLLSVVLLLISIIGFLLIRFLVQNY